MFTACFGHFVQVWRAFSWDFKAHASTDFATRARVVSLHCVHQFHYRGHALPERGDVVLEVRGGLGLGAECPVEKIVHLSARPSPLRFNPSERTPPLPREHARRVVAFHWPPPVSTEFLQKVA